MHGLWPASCPTPVPLPLPGTAGSGPIAGYPLSVERASSTAGTAPISSSHAGVARPSRWRIVGRSVARVGRGPVGPYRHTMPLCLSSSFASPTFCSDAWSNCGNVWLSIDGSP